MQKVLVRSALETKLRELWSGQLKQKHSRSKAVVPTGLVRLDSCLSGGLPWGVTELYGPDSVGKTALTAHIITECQINGMFCVLFASDYYDGGYLEALGVDVKNLIYVNNAESFKYVLQKATTIDKTFCFIIDSLTNAFLDMAQASSLLLEYKSTLSNKSILIYTSQVRARSLNNFSRKLRSASIRLNTITDCCLAISREQVSEKKFIQVVNIQKAASAVPGRILSLPFEKGKGVLKILDLVKLGKENGLIECRGSYLYFENELLGQGEEAASTNMHRTTQETLTTLLLSGIVNAARINNS